MSRMPPTKKRKTTRKSVATTKPIKARRTAGKRGAGDRRKSLVLDVVQQLEHKLEEIPGKLRKTARKTKAAAARSKVVQKVVNTIEEGTKSIRKAAKKTVANKTATKTVTKKKARRV